LADLFPDTFGHTGTFWLCGATSDGFYGLELHRGDGNASRVLSIGGGAEGTGYGATSNVNAYGLGSYPPLGNESTEVNFLVVKFSFGVDNGDAVEIFRNPASLRDEQACSIDAVLKGNFAFDRISLGNLMVASSMKSTRFASEPIFSRSLDVGVAIVDGCCGK
jgi:hypothetical protein